MVRSVEVTQLPDDVDALYEVRMLAFLAQEMDPFAWARLSAASSNARDPESTRQAMAERIQVLIAPLLDGTHSPDTNTGSVLGTSMPPRLSFPFPRPWFLTPV